VTPRRFELADLYLSSEVARLMSLQVASLQARGGVPNYEASMVKLLGSELALRHANLAVRLLGPSGLLLNGSRGREVAGGRPAHNYSGVLPTTMAGGTSEVQRSIIATRGLGLPRGQARIAGIRGFAKSCHRVPGIADTRLREEPAWRHGTLRGK
jgi:alkylation response protein AidB-like acyl-CoA dehydrogenase